MIRLVIPNKGRISGEVLKLLEKIGIEVPKNGRKLYANTNNPNIKIVYARAADIPLYVQAGAADVGITGDDVIKERGADVERLLKLNFGVCKIAVAAPKDSKIKSPKDYRDGLRVATKLVRTTEQYFKSKKIRCEIVSMNGATELAPYLGIADLIVDQVSTGTTLTENNLQIIDIIGESNIYLITNQKSIDEKNDEVDSLKISIEGVITAEVKRYIMMNVTSDEALARVVKVVPCMESPTVLKLAKEGEYSVHSVVDSGSLIETIRKVKKAGAKDILVLNMSRIVE